LEFFFETLWESLGLLATADASVLSAVLVSLQVTLAATVLSTTMGLPLAYVLWAHRFRGREVLVTLNHALLGVPTVALGLFLYIIICRRGPLGELNLLFTRPAMILGQALLGLPIVVALSYAALKSLDPRARATALTLGAGPMRVGYTMIGEARFAIAAAVITAFGRLVGEVGISMMLGGNVAGRTRNISTAIALETSKGEFAFGMALGIFLIAVALGVNILLRFVQGDGGKT
jgi:tungstate transport system permease protein